MSWMTTKSYDNQHDSIPTIPEVKIDQLLMDMNEIYKSEKLTGGEHSLYFKRLFELMAYYLSLPKAITLGILDTPVTDFNKKRRSLEKAYLFRRKR